MCGPVRFSGGDVAHNVCGEALMFTEIVPIVLYEIDKMTKSVLSRAGERIMNTVQQS